MIQKNITINLDDNLAHRLDDLCNELGMSFNSMVSLAISNVALNNNISNNYIHRQFNNESLDAFEEAEVILKNEVGSGFKSMTEFREAMRS